MSNHYIRARDLSTDLLAALAFSLGRPPRAADDLLTHGPDPMVNIPAPLLKFCVAVGFLWMAGNSVGCVGASTRWPEPEAMARASLLEQLCRSPTDLQQRLELAIQQERAGLEACVDTYFAIAIDTPSRCAGPLKGECELYQTALQKLVVTGQAFGRLDPRKGLVVNWRGQRQLIPIERHGFVWQAEDFDHLTLVGDYRARVLPTLYRCAGAGIPLVVTRCNRDHQPLMAPQSNFAATLCLRAGDSPALELYDPLRTDRRVGSGELITRDLSAPLVYDLKNNRDSIINDFFNPFRIEEPSQLVMQEPFQPGKIPVVMIHGLLSDPYTWEAMVNELRATPWFVEHYQLWFFDYPTGQSFLASAAAMREQLQLARALHDPLHSDPQFSQMVLVGHSMGGLIAKLQVAASGDVLWRSIANRPIEQVAIPASLQETIADSFFFNPSPDVTRVVFIATPHQGTILARRLVGRIGAALVQVPSEYQQAHEQMIASNPGVFDQEFRRRIPTSIDLLEPDSELLQAMSRLPIDVQSVPLHSIVGDALPTLRLGRSDGVVPVQSARERRASSERVVSAKHAEMNKHPATIAEVKRTLCIHMKKGSDMSHTVLAE